MEEEDSEELLNREAFESLMFKINPSYSNTELENIFLACDENCTGLITMASIKDHLQNAARQEEEYEEQQHLYNQEVQRLIAENESLRNRIKTEIPNLEKEKFELEMKLSKVERRASMLEDDNSKLTSDVAMLQNLEQQFRQTERRKEETEGRLAKAEADVSRYRNMWEADRETMKTLREENSELINTVTKLNLSKDEAQTDMKQLQIQFDNMKSLKEHLEETLKSHLDTQDAHVDAREDQFIEREKALMTQINNLSKEVMDLKLQRRQQSHQMKSYEKRPSLPLNYTAERLEGESLGEQLGELDGEAINTLNRIRELNDENILLKEENAKLSKIISQHKNRETMSNNLDRQHQDTLEKIMRENQRTVEKLMGEKAELLDRLNVQMDTQHELKRKISVLESEKRAFEAQSTSSLKSQTEQTELRNQLAGAKLQHEKERKALEMQLAELEKKLDHATPGESITFQGPEAEALKEIREKLGDGKMSGVYHCLEVGMSYAQIKQLVKMKSDLHLSGDYLRLGFHFNEVKVLGPAVNKPLPETSYTWTLKRLGVLVRDIRKLIDLEANLSHAVKCTQAGMPFDEINGLIMYKINELDHVARCYEVGMTCAEIKDIWEVRSKFYMPLHGVYNCFESGLSLEEIKELTRKDIYLFHAAECIGMGLSYEQVLKLGQNDRRLDTKVLLKLKKMGYEKLMETLRGHDYLPDSQKELVRSESAI